MRALVACMLVLSVPVPAEACRRCGYYSPCRVYVAPKVVQQVVEKKVYVPQQTIIFNNAYPAAPPGQVQYSAASYQSYASAYQPTAAQFLSLSQAQLAASQQVAQLGAGQAQLEAGLQAFREQTNQILAITQHLRAGLTGQAGGSQTLILQIGADGTVRQVTPEQVAPAAQPDNGQGQGQSPQAGGVLAAKCAKCHGGQTPKGEFYFDGVSPIDDATFRVVTEILALGKTRSGITMPPESEGSLTAEEKARSLEELLSLKGSSP